MRLWIFSCLQLDHPGQPGHAGGDALPGPVPDADVAVVAGDMHPPLERSLARLAPLARRMPVVYVPGNRDFYPDPAGALPRRTMREAETEGAKAARAAGITLLLDDAVTIQGTRFVGGTLWTDYELHGDAPRDMAAAMAGMSDHRCVEEDAGFPFDADAALRRHRAARRSIATALANPHNGPTVVVSHHAPHPDSVRPQFVGDPMTPAFASDLTKLMSGPSAPDLWVHGGLHGRSDYAVGRTRVVSNSRGYPHENPAFEPGLVVDVGQRALTGGYP